jgi:hypothetical protein
MEKGDDDDEDGSGKALFEVVPRVSCVLHHKIEGIVGIFFVFERVDSCFTLLSRLTNFL